MRRFIILALAFLVLSIAGGTQEAWAADPAGHAFCRNGIPNNEWLAANIEKSLKARPDGKGRVDGCYATVHSFYEAFKRGDVKTTHLNSISDLPAYIRSWTTEKAKADYQYNSACIYDMAGGVQRVEMGCRPRDLHPGEVIYKNPETGALVLLSGCANPGVTEVPPIVVQANPCIEVHWPTELTPGRRAVRFAYIGDKPLSANVCSIALSMAGVSGKLIDMPEECPDRYPANRGGRIVLVVCAWDAVEEVASQHLGYRAQVQNVSGSYWVRATGDNVLYLPEAALRGETVVCWELPDGTFVTYGVRKDNFVNGVARIPASVVYGH
jgi:hypothetical protein